MFDFLIREDRAEVLKLSAPRQSKADGSRLTMKLTLRLRYERDDATVNRLSELVPGCVEAVKAATADDSALRLVYTSKPGLTQAIRLEGVGDDDAPVTLRPTTIEVVAVLETVKLTSSTDGTLVDSTISLDVLPIEVEALARILLDRGAKVQGLQTGFEFPERVNVKGVDADIPPVRFDGGDVEGSGKRTSTPSVARRPVDRAVEDIDAGLYDHCLADELEREEQARARPLVTEALRARQGLIEAAQAQG